MPLCEYHPAYTPAHQHVRVMCSCGAVIARCRCRTAGPYRTIETRDRACPACQAAQGLPPTRCRTARRTSPGGAHAPRCT